MPTQIGARRIPAKTLYEISLGISSLTQALAARELDDIERVSAEFHWALSYLQNLSQKPKFSKNLGFKFNF